MLILGFLVVHLTVVSNLAQPFWIINRANVRKAVGIEKTIIVILAAYIKRFDGRRCQIPRLARFFAKWRTLMSGIMALPRILRVPITELGFGSG